MTAANVSRQPPYLTSGGWLGTNQYLVSMNELFFAIVQGDGNFCVYVGSGPNDNTGTLLFGLQGGGPGVRVRPPRPYP